MENVRSLTASQLEQLDLIITRAQEKNRAPGDLVRYTEDTEGLVDAHHFFDLSERDRGLLTQIQDLASQIEATVPLSRLMELRAQAVRSMHKG
jgi:hypothetical protein